MIYLYRIWNFVHIILCYWYSLLFKKVCVAPLPFAVTIEPTNKCNLQCLECPTGNKSLSREKGEISVLLFEKIIKSVYKKTFYLNLYFQGEPFLHNDIIKMIRLARSHKMYVVLSTNAQHINEKLANEIVNSKLSKIIISLDGLSQETYEKYRKGGNVEKVKQSIKYLVESKKRFKQNKPLIEIQILVNRYNEDELSKIKQWLKSFKNLKIKLKSMQIYNNFTYLPKNEKYKRYIFNGIQWKLKQNIRNRCFRIWSQCVITHNGIVVPCCFDKNAEYPLGNLNHLSLKQIWNGVFFNKYRMNVLNNRNNINICNNCTEY